MCCVVRCPFVRFILFFSFSFRFFFSIFFEPMAGSQYFALSVRLFFRLSYDIIYVCI